MTHELIGYELIPLDLELNELASWPVLLYYSKRGNAKKRREEEEEEGDVTQLQRLSKLPFEILPISESQ